MAAYKGSNFNDRRDAAQEAKQALVARFQSRPNPDDPAVLAKQAELRAVAEARELRNAERQRHKLEADAQNAAANEARKAEEEARAAAEVVRAAEQAARDEAIREERKQARDTRYAARKARQKR